MKIYDVVILGGGASALMFASNLKKSFDAVIVEHNSKLAQKLKISGGGKCNITNVDVSVDNFDGDKKLVNHALKSFSRDNLLTFLDRNRVDLEIRKKRYYFCEHSSEDVIEVFKRSSKKIEKKLDTSVLSVEKKDELFYIKTTKSDLVAKNVVVATGAKSFHGLGATDIGLNIAKSFDIKVKEFTPALVGMTLQKEQFWMKELSGLSCYVHIDVAGKTLKEEMLFAHKGISGPCVLSASLYWQKGDMNINFLPNKNIFELITNSKKLLSSAIPLPKRLSKAILKALDVQDIECKKITSKMKEKLAQIHSYKFAPAGNFGFSKAEVCRGGVSAEEIDYKTMGSKKVEGLYFIGEVVDVTGELGGYNFQWAFSSAVVCAKALNKKGSE